MQNGNKSSVGENFFFQKIILYAGLYSVSMFSAALALQCVTSNYVELSWKVFF